MTKATFRHDFLRGSGSALIELQSNANTAQFSDIIFHGCLNNTTYDIQCEGDRGWYLHQAAKLSGDEIALEEAVVQKFFRIGKDIWLFNQLTSILYHFAVDGSETSRNAIYHQYENMLLELSRKRAFKQICNRRDMFDWLCVWLTSLDGWSAFKTIVGDVSMFLLPKNADFFFSDWFYSNAEGKFGEKRVEQYLQKKSVKSSNIRFYYEKAKEWDDRPQIKRPIPTLSDVLEAAKKPFGGRGIGMRFARHASPEDLEKLAQAVMSELDAAIQIELLWGFRLKKRYDFPEEFLLQLSQSENEQLRSLSYEIIGQSPSNETRELARYLIQSGKDIGNGISLLARNPLLKDEELLFDAVKSFRPHRDKGDWHGAYMCARDGVDAMRGKPRTNILEYLYRNTLCGFCREHIIRTMHKKGILSDEVLRECLFDANFDLQTFAKRLTWNRNHLRT